MRRIGLIGGISWCGTREYYTQLNRLARAHGLRAGSSFSSCDLMIRSLDFADVLQHADSLVVVEKMFVTAALDLQAAGAEVLAVCSGTGQLYAGGISRELGVPLVPFSDVLCKVLPGTVTGPLMILGTLRMLQHGELQERLRNHGMQICQPTKQCAEMLNRAIFEELMFDRIGPLMESAVTRIDMECAAEGIDDVLLACTELPLFQRTHPLRARVHCGVQLHCGALYDEAIRSFPITSKKE